MFILKQFVFFLVVLQVFGQQGFKPSITCYMKYDHQETKSPTLDTVLSYSYHQTEVTQYATPDGKLCSKVGCACFSYRSVCSYAAPGSNHYSQCTDDDRQYGRIQWHRGWTSHDQCEEMRRHPHTYMNLTCCYADRCNDQPGKVITMADTHLPIQRQDPYGYQTPQAQPLAISYRTSPRYHSHSHSHSHYTTSTHASDTYRSNPTYDRSSPIKNSLSMNSFSKWFMFFTLIFMLVF